MALAQVEFRICEKTLVTLVALWCVFMIETQLVCDQSWLSESLCATSVALGAVDVSPPSSTAKLDPCMACATDDGWPKSSGNIGKVSTLSRQAPSGRTIGITEYWLPCISYTRATSLRVAKMIA
jgi:hypothetical protein